MKHLSMRSRIRSETCLRLDHINFGPENPRSRRLQESRQALKLKALLRLTCLPPNLSSLHSTLLKSLKRSQGTLCNWAT